MKHALFRDRTDAGRQLAAKLRHLAAARPVVLALPRGGVPVALAVARALRAPLDLLLVRKIGAPGQPELAVGAVIDGENPRTVINPEIADMLGLSAAAIADAARREIGEIERRRLLYLRGRNPLPVAGRTVIVIDDGIATGASIRVALSALRAAGAARVVLAVPVAPTDTVEALRGEGDEIVCVSTPADFRAVGAYYADFRQLTDAEVTELLGQAETQAS